MCGIAGILMGSRRSESLRASAIRMADAIRHRGPDDGDVWVDDAQGLALAHRRLSILDLSPAGHQPMQSACGRYVIVFNGEIYNHLELRQQLQDGGAVFAWRGHSDTETLLAGIATWGVERTLSAAVGMFAFAVWNRETRSLTVARDRLGEKPLYYGRCDGAFVFASELKAVRALEMFNAEIDRNALAALMRFGYVPEPYCIYVGFRKLLPGTYMEINGDTVARGGLPEPKAYWSALDVARDGIAHPLTFVSDAEAVAALDRQLREAVRLQMVADVPLGAFLSGGVDSSTVVALMQAQSTLPVKTFSIGFNESSYNEAQYAKAVAEHLRTDHTELYVSPQDALATIPDMPAIYDEPFADSSQIPTYLVARMARQHVTVSLSGDGGDELFGGYTRYFVAARVWQKLGRIPRPIRRVLAGGARALSPSQWNTAFRVASPILPAKYRSQLPGDKLHKAARVVAGRDASELYRGLVSQWDPADIMLNAQEPSTALDRPWPVLPTLTEQMMALDAVTYLPGDILTKVDRAAMRVSLETRVPILDHRVFEFAWRLPLHFKVRQGVGKWLLRQVLYAYVPQTLIDRPKMGFGVPIDSWLRGPLRDWAESLLNESRLNHEGYFDSAVVLRRWREHLSGHRNWQYPLWNVLMFQSWQDAQRQNQPRSYS